MSDTKRHPLRWLAIALLMLGAPGVSAQLERPPATKPTVMPAGPAWLTAGGYIPTWLILKWAAVPNARYYQIYRRSEIEARHLVSEQDATLAAGQDVEGNAYWRWDYPVDMTSTYSYEVQAVFVDDAGTRTLSAPSPTASAKSPPWLAPADFGYTAGLYSTTGKLRLTFTWSPIPNAQQYDVFFRALNGSATPLGTRTSKSTTLVVDDVNPRAMYEACIVTVYMPSVRNDTVRSCIKVGR